MDNWVHVMSCTPHDRLKKAWIVEFSAPLDAKVGELLWQQRLGPMGVRGNWKIVGKDTNGRFLLEPQKGTRDNMLPGDKFGRMI